MLYPTYDHWVYLLLSIMDVEEWVYERPDFAASLQAIPQPETDLRSSLRQGIKLDLMYKGDESGAWMIYYALLDEERRLLSQGVVCHSEVKAYFRVLNPELRLTVHKQRVKPGIRFFVVVGSHKVAEGIVTEVLHLLDED
jgi:hypothetical protein